MTARESFRYIPSAPPLNSNPLYIIDTNVLSVFRSLTQKGFDAKDISHRRAKELLDTFYSQPSGVSCDFAILETSGLSQGCFYTREALQSCTLSMALFMQSKEDAQNFLAQAEPVSAIAASPDELESNLVEIFDASKTLHGLIGTSFVISTTVIEAVQKKEDWRTSIKNCLEEISKIGLLPPKALALVALTFAGTPTIRQLITQRLLKTQKTGAVSVFSATNDLAFLILQRFKAMTTGRPVVVVTNDDGFADFAGLLTQTDIGDAVSPEAFDPTREKEFDEIYMQFLEKRACEELRDDVVLSPERIAAEVAKHANSLKISPPALEGLEIKSYIRLPKNIAVDAFAITRDLAFANNYSDEALLSALESDNSGVTISDILSASAQVYASLLNTIRQEFSESLDVLCEEIPAISISMFPEEFAISTEEFFLKLAMPINFMNAAARRCDLVMRGLGDRMYDRRDQTEYEYNLALLGYCTACLKILRCVAKYVSQRTGEDVLSCLQSLRSLEFKLDDLNP